MGARRETRETGGERRFERRPERFRCEHCAVENLGDGYTNHCVACLWSKHVDIRPGDRNELCRGMMAPVAVERRRGRDVLVHRCERCGAERRNRLAAGDDVDVVVSVAASASSARRRAR